MTVAASLKKLFKKHRANYQVYYYKETTSLHLAAEYLDISTTNIIKVEVLADTHGYVLAVIPLNSSIDFLKIKQKLNRNLHILPEVKANRIFYDCQRGNRPPFARSYKINHIIIDYSILNLDKLFFVAGSNSSIVEMSLCDFLYINSSAKKFSFIKNYNKLDKPNYDVAKESIPTDKFSLQTKCCMPNLPDAAKSIFDLISKKDLPIDEMAQLISNDNFIHEQILNYSSSSFFKNKYGEINNSKEDESNSKLLKFLSFDTVSHVAFSAALSKAFSQKQNIEEVTRYWQHALYSGALAYNLSERIVNANENISIVPKKCYFAALLHNIGFLLLAELYPPEFKLLMKWIKLYPKTPVNVLEKKLLGMGQARKVLKYGHANLGASLLKFWGMPEYVCLCAKHHHDSAYEGKDFEYVLLIQLVNQLLGNVNIGDCIQGNLSNKLLEIFNIDKNQVDGSLKDLLEGENNFDHIASVMTN